MVSGLGVEEKGSAPNIDGVGGLVGDQGPLLIEFWLSGLNHPPCAYGLLTFIEGHGLCRRASGGNDASSSLKKSISNEEHLYLATDS